MAAWDPGTPSPLIPPYLEPEEHRQVPESVAAAEEAHLIWRWLTGEHVRLLDATHPLDSPARPVPPLSLAA